MRATVLWGAVVIAATMTSISACTAGPPEDAASPSESAPAADGAECPDGTSEAEALCVADTDEARAAADVVRSVFESESLGSVIIGVWRAGDPLLVGALGETLTGVPATVDMHHRTGNVGHSMVETVLLQQVEKGTVALDDPLSKYLPDLPSADQITIDMVAHSTSGYQQYTIVPEFQSKLYEDPFARWDIDDVIAYGVDGGPMYTPGTDWNFSDTNILILAQVLEVATGTPIADLVQEGIFDPLGMDETTSPANAYLPDPILHAYTGERGVWEEATFWEPSWTSFAGGWGSTQDDLRTLIEAVGTGALLSDESHEMQLAPTSVGLGTNTDERYYGMGISVVNDWLLTAPGLQGYHASVGYLRDQELTVVIYFTTTPEYDTSNRSTLLFEPLSAILAPENAVDLG
ncbi:CubicO group peptidase, beta-lactamase class C family [Microbacterium sp. cf046]|uniref:serine hydrolase domain-containing protein n=1 Tax=Microbacterium sp. cf046 TaxID=1761803 RepID=UPI0008EE0551|nr:serine hydrolase domain-containing protein [Microbacterium sp. cf046]SFS15176.1 CubicO group peptidase, beta-lactamase class C family [Microbacterium sp. cf046]